MLKVLPVLHLLNIQKILKLDNSVLTTLTTSALLNLNMDLVWLPPEHRERLCNGKLDPWVYDLWFVCLLSGQPASLKWPTCCLIDERIVEGDRISSQGIGWSKKLVRAECVRRCYFSVVLQWTFFFLSFFSFSLYIFIISLTGEACSIGVKLVE